MVSSFSNPGLPHVHAHPTRLPAMDARLSAAIDSFEASMRAAIRDAIYDAMDSALTVIHKAVNPVLAQIRSDLAPFHRDLTLGVEGDSDPASMCSEDAELIEVGHQNPQNGDHNPLRISSTIHDHSIPPLLSSSPMLRALANSSVKPQSNDSIAALVSLPESKRVIHASTMTSALRLLRKHFFFDTTETGAEVVLYLRFIITTSEAIFPSLLTANYSAFGNDKYGWINWYLVGKFVKKNFCALKLFDEMSKSQNDNMFIQPLTHSIEVLHLDCLAIQLHYFDFNCYLGFEYGSTIALGRAFAYSSGFSQTPMFGAFGSNLAQTSPFESPTQTSQVAFGASIIDSFTPFGDMCYCNGIWDKGGGSKFNKMQLKMAVARIKLLRNKRQAVVKQMRHDIALLLQSGKTTTAQIRVEHVIREHNTLAANEFIELFCELVVSRLSIIAEQRECNRYCNQDIDIVSLKEIKEASPLSLTVSLRSTHVGRFQSLDQFLSREYRISLVDNLESKVKLRDEDYYQLFSEVHKFDDGISEFNNMVSAIQVMVTQSDVLKLKFDEGFTMSKLWFLNLGGSARQAKTEVQGESLKEAQNINNSLSALGDMISTLSRIKALNWFGHVDEYNVKAISLFEIVEDLSDAIEGEVKWVENLSRGIFAGNIFAFGYAQVAEVLPKDGMFFLVSCQNLVPRPWVIDDLDAALVVSVMVYSACSINSLGNEAVVAEILRRGGGALHGIKLQGMSTSIEDKSKKENLRVFLDISIDRDLVEQLVIEFLLMLFIRQQGISGLSVQVINDHLAIHGVENIKCWVRIYPMLETANIANVQDLSFIMEFGNKSDMVLNILQPSHNVVRNDAMDQEGKGTNGVEPHDLRPIIIELPLLDPEEVNNGVLEMSKLNAMTEKVIAVRNKQVAINGEMKFEPNLVDVLDGYDGVVGESSTSLSSSFGFGESSYLSWVENFEMSQENCGEATGNKNSLTQFRRAAILGSIIMISKPSSTISFLSLEDKANFQGGSIVMTQIIIEVLCFITVRNC